MEEILRITGLSIAAYLLGSIPSAVWIGRSLYGIDVREHGSGNAGATNTFRVLGKKAGSIVLVMDILKGFAAACLIYAVPDIDKDSIKYVNLQLLFGLLAVLGHLFPLFAQFRGGKGIATLFGMLIGIHYPSALVCLGIFLIVLLTTKYVSLSSILTALSFPLSIIFIFKAHEPLFIAFGISVAILVVLTHQKNIKKLIEGTENKAKLFKKNS